MKINIGLCKKQIVIILSLIMIVLSVNVAAARTTYTTSFTFPAGKSAYGPAYYHTKNNNAYTWNATYSAGWNASVSVYLYDRTAGAQATSAFTVARESNTGERSYLGSSVWNPNHEYKIVAIRDISNFSGAYWFSFEWTI